MPVEIKSIEAVAKCDICGREVALKLDNYSRMPHGFIGNRVIPSLRLMHDAAFPEFTFREFRKSYGRSTRFMICKECAEAVDNKYKEIDKEQEQKRDSIVDELWKASGFQPPEDDPYFR